MLNKTILVVSEDVQEITDMTQALKQIGYEKILPVQGGKNAWAQLKSARIDGVIAAYEMEDLSGITLLKMVRREHSLADLPFFLTHDAFTRLKVIRAGQLGVTGLFVTPSLREGIKTKLSLAFGKTKAPLLVQAEKNLEKGISLIENKEYAQALEVFQALVTQRENPEYYFNIGFIKTNQGLHNEAIEAFTKATQLDRLFVKAYEAMAKAYKAMGDSQKAEECLQTAAEIYMDSDKLGSAEEILNEILESGSNSLNVFNTLGVIHRKKGDIQQALRQYKKALKVHPDEPYIYYNIGRLYLDIKNSTQAREYFQTALDKDHGFDEARQVIKAIDLGIV